MNLFELFVKIGVKDEASGQLGKITSALGSGLKAAASVGVAAIGVAASGIAALTTAAVKNYAEYEQLVGGVETLFGIGGQSLKEYAAEQGKAISEVQDEWMTLTAGQRFVLNNAENAYKTAGLSANEYMSTVTSFSASLLQSLGGDTQAAADLADQALRDMSDNANKMGSDMSIIIATYQSLARGNYAMLDNLKLGYGGTKAEMKRLIATAAELDSSVKANDMSFGNMLQAIHVVQTEMGITGTTALEAATTIQGSVSAMKAAWQNLVTGIADENADFDGLISSFVETVGTVGDNLLPRIEIALNGVADLVSQLAPKIFEVLPTLVNSILPKLADAAVNVVQTFVSSIQSNQGTIVETAVSVVMTLVNGIITLLPQIIETGLQLVLNLVIGIAGALPELIPAAVDMIMQVVQTLVDNIPLLIEAALALIEGLAQGLIEALPVLIQAVPEIVVTLVTTLIENLPLVLDIGLQVIFALISGILQALPELAQAAVDIVDGLIKGLIGAWPNIIENFKGLINTLISAVKAVLGIHSPSTVFAGIGNFLAQGFGQGFANAWGAIQSSIVSKIQGLVEMARSAASAIASTLAAAGEGISNIMADGGTINSGLEAAQARGKTGGGVTVNNYNINSSKQTATEIIKETKYINNRAVMTY